MSRKGAMHTLFGEILLDFLLFSHEIVNNQQNFSIEQIYNLDFYRFHKYS